MKIAVASSRKSKSWKNINITWEELVVKLSTAVVKTHNYKDFAKMSKDLQSDVKDVGGYVGGELNSGDRKKYALKNRILITLDVDFPEKGNVNDFDLLYGYAAILHSTHSHTPQKPRLRLVIPMTRAVTPDEYQAIARSIAGGLGIAAFDETTFEPNRLMFWPSVPYDVKYEFLEFKGPILDPDIILNSYENWRDVTKWPVNENTIRALVSAGIKQKDPTEKGGYIGAFCRTYTISEVIETYLNDVYTPAQDGRYTFIAGSTSGGLVIYDNDTFAYSHHGTDPACGTLNNAYDLVLKHKFPGDKGEEQMRELIFADTKVRAQMLIDDGDFSIPLAEDNSTQDLKEEVDLKWLKEMIINKGGGYLPVATNFSLIFEHDPNLKGKFRYNIFDQKTYVFGPLPWRKLQDDSETIRNVDYSGVRVYIEKVYKIHNAQKVDDALALAAEANAFHPIRDYLNSTKWDGINRIGDLLPTYLGAENTAYTREAMTKTMVGAVARAFKPGVKFDYCLTLTGPQGCGKSTLVRKLSNGWYSDSFNTVQGTQAFEQVQGSWFIEVAELAGIRKADVEAVKHFLSKQEDTYRPAYGRTVETYKRQCVFIATTNDDPFLRDSTGNRRFLPVSVRRENSPKNIEDLTSEHVEQLWAEAVVLYNRGESLVLSVEVQEVAAQTQEAHLEVDSRKGLVEEFLEKKITKDWEDKSIEERRLHLGNLILTPEVDLRDREYVCSAEIWCECFGKFKEDFDRYKTRDINELMRFLPNWEPVKKTKKFNGYGYQRYFKRLTKL
jgi:predicted P-loop ATPase